VVFPFALANDVILGFPYRSKGISLAFHPAIAFSKAILPLMLATALFWLLPAAYVIIL
jgi:hypothetical protein